MRYFDRLSKTEVIKGVHDISGEGVIGLPDDSVFFQPLPQGKVVSFDDGGLPVGLVDAPLPTIEEIKAEESEKSREYLRTTDWYVIRQQETGKAVPAEIIEARAAARARVV